MEDILQLRIAPQLPQYPLPSARQSTQLQTFGGRITTAADAQAQLHKSHGFSIWRLAQEAENEIASDRVDRAYVLSFIDHLWELSALPSPSCVHCGESCYCGAVLCLHCVTGPTTPSLGLIRLQVARRPVRSNAKSKSKQPPKETLSGSDSVVKASPVLGHVETKHDTDSHRENDPGAHASDASNDLSTSSKMPSDTCATSDPEQLLLQQPPSTEADARLRNSKGDVSPIEADTPRPISCVCANCKNRYKCPWRSEGSDDGCDQLVWLSRFALTELNLLSSCMLDRLDLSEVDATKLFPGAAHKAATHNQGLLTLGKTLGRFPRLSDIQEQMRISTTLAQTWSEHCARQAEEPIASKRGARLWDCVPLSDAASRIQSTLTWLYLELAAAETLGQN